MSSRNSRRYALVQRLLIAGALLGWGATITMTWDRSPVIYTPFGLAQNLVLVAGSFGLCHQLVREILGRPRLPLWLFFSIGIAIGVQVRVLSMALAAGLVMIDSQVQHLLLVRLIARGRQERLASLDAKDRNACYETTADPFTVDAEHPEYVRLFAVADSLEMFSTNTLDHWWELFQLAEHLPGWSFEATPKQVHREDHIHLLPTLALFLAGFNIDSLSRLEILLIGVILGLLLMALILIVVMVFVTRLLSSSR